MTRTREHVRRGAPPTGRRGWSRLTWLTRRREAADLAGLCGKCVCCSGRRRVTRAEDLVQFPPHRVLAAGDLREHRVHGRDRADLDQRIDRVEHTKCGVSRTLRRPRARSAWARIRLCGAPRPLSSAVSRSAARDPSTAPFPILPAVPASSGFSVPSWPHVQGRRGEGDHPGARCPTSR